MQVIGHLLPTLVQWLLVLNSNLFWNNLVWDWSLNIKDGDVFTNTLKCTTLFQHISCPGTKKPLCYFSWWGHAPDLGLTNHYYYYSLHCSLHSPSCRGTTITTATLKHNCQQQFSCNWCHVQPEDHRKSVFRVVRKKLGFLTRSYRPCWCLSLCFFNRSFIESRCFLKSRHHLIQKQHQHATNQKQPVAVDTCS